MAKVKERKQTSKKKNLTTKWEVGPFNTEGWRTLRIKKRILESNQICYLKQHRQKEWNDMFKVLRERNFAHRVHWAKSHLWKVLNILRQNRTWNSRHANNRLREQWHQPNTQLRQQKRYPKIEWHRILSVVNRFLTCQWTKSSPSKRHRVAARMRKQNPAICCLQEAHLKIQDRHRFRRKKRMENFYET